jgi:hypothetical protein
MSQYTLDLDIPTTELTEMGYANARYLSDLDPESIIPEYNNLWFEPSTGTVLLKPVQLTPDWNNSSAAESLKLRLSDFNVTPGYWEEMPARGNMLLVPTDYFYRTKIPSATLLNVLTLVAIETVMANNGVELVPVMESKVSYPANQGFMLSVELADREGRTAENYLGLMFGQFFLSCHTDGTMDLYWSNDGTRTQASWEFRKRFSSMGAPRHMGTAMLMGMPTPTRSMIDIMIVPFGRGNIWIRVSANGQVYNGVYTHPEATWDTELGGYQITDAGTVLIYTDPTDLKSIGLQLSKIGYVTSGYLDEFWKLPYMPTETPITATSYTKTMGTCSASVAMYDITGDPWVSSGLLDRLYTRLTLTGDGTGTPWVDGYSFYFPPKIETYTPAEFTIPHSAINKLQIEHGESWDDQRITVIIEDHGEYTSLRTRGKINGRLNIDGVPYMLATFERPSTKLGRRLSYITLTGKNLGAYRLDRRKFFHPPTFDGWTHPAAISYCLQLCGFPVANIDTDADVVTLPYATTTGGGNQDGTTQSKSQPQFNQPVRDFTDWIQQNLSSWKLWYDADGIWHYRGLSTEIVPIATFYETTAGHTLWYDDLTIDTDPAEGNQVMLIGKSDSGEVLANIARRLDQQSLYGVDQIIIADMSIPTMEVLDDILDKQADISLYDVVNVSWRGPFSPILSTWSIVTVENVGNIRITNIATEANSPIKLEKDASTLYTGVLLPMEV